MLKIHGEEFMDGRSILIASMGLPWEGEYLLSYLPIVVYVQFPFAKWRISALPVGMYPMRQKKKAWIVNEKQV